ncbi:MAG: UbiD family decarboxylase [Chloroflexi bacterium]|nr:UbiD family decarboxylase [Chloroflexota bacterium]
MSLRNHINKLEGNSEITRISEPVSKTYQIAAILNQLEPTPAIFENVNESSFQVVGNLSCTKQSFADYFGIPTSKIIPMLTNAIENRSQCEVVSQPACQEVVNMEPDLDQLPVLRHCEGDGGNYISSGIFIANHPKFGQNIDFHRCMQISKTEMAVRIVRSRNFDTFLQDLKEVDVAICIGNSPNVMAAAATSVSIGIDELEIANAMEPVKVVRAKTVDVYVPAEAEFILEGTVYLCGFKLLVQQCFYF